MRLLKFRERDDSEHLDISIHEYNSHEAPPYAILSHKWGPTEDEVSFREITQADHYDLAKQKKGFGKLEGCCRQALKDNLSHAWIDTCCIDKSSSAELSEAINSMFNWYGQARVCYVYLEDVKSEQDLYSPGSSFRNSQWFKRGWTLQEMIAPTNTRFFAADWIELGHKHQLAELLQEITKVSQFLLLNSQKLKDFCASQKMYWASGRQTTRVEDRAYSLLGLFNINIPILYGEGSRAFIRLQEEIIRSSSDHTLFAWELKQSSSGLLADSADAFANSANVRELSQRDYDNIFAFPKLDYTVTNLGVHIKLPRRRIRSHKCLHIVFLACQFEGRRKPIFLYLRRHSDKVSDRYFRTRKLKRSMGDGLEITPFERTLFQSQPKIWIAEPKESLARAIGPLIPDELAEKWLEKEEDIQSYYIRLFCQGNVLAVLPMADHLHDHDLTIETVNGGASVASMLLRHDCKVFIILAVIEGRLLIHVEIDDSSQEDGNAGETALQQCESFLEGCKSSRQTPCTQAVWKSGTIKETSGEESIGDVLVEVLQSKHTDMFFERKVFSVWLRLSPKQDSDMSIMDRPEAWEKQLADLLKNCRSLHESYADYSHVYNNISSTYTDRDKQFAFEHAANKDIHYIDGYKNGLERVSKVGQTVGKQNILYSKYNMGPGGPGGKTFADREEEEKEETRKNLQEGQTEEVEDIHVSSHKSGDDCPCFNHGFVKGYRDGYKEVVNPYIIGPRTQDYIVGHGYAYGNKYWNEHYLKFLSVVAIHSIRVPEEVYNCTSVYARAIGVGFLAGTEAGRAERFCLKKEQDDDEKKKDRKDEDRKRDGVSSEEATDSGKDNGSKEDSDSE